MLRVSYANEVELLEKVKKDRKELLEKVKKDIKNRLEKHRFISSSTKETSMYIVDFVLSCVSTKY